MPEKLTLQEEEAMQVIWKAGEGNVKTFLSLMPDPAPPYTTLASTIKNLEKKGFVSGRMVGNMYLYKPSISEEQYKKQFMNGFIKDYFENSYMELVTFFAREKKISPDELKTIIQMIEDGKKKA